MSAVQRWDSGSEARRNQQFRRNRSHPLVKLKFRGIDGFVRKSMGFEGISKNVPKIENVDGVNIQSRYFLKMLRIDDFFGGSGPSLWSFFPKTDFFSGKNLHPVPTFFLKAEKPIFPSKTFKSRRVPPSDFGKSVPFWSSFFEEFIR